MSGSSFPSVDLHTQSEAAVLAEKLGLPLPLVSLLFSRGYRNVRDIQDFLYPVADHLHDPFLLPDMRSAADAILLAVDQGEDILIYGDYDADGVTSAACLCRYLDGIGGHTVCYIPDRLGEGYGLSTSVLETFGNRGIGLMVTVDTGTTAPAEVAYARSLGIKTVVTDHHECAGALPRCIAVVNPMRQDSAYPFKGLAGVGVAFKLICALESTRHPEKTVSLVAQELLERYGDLVALGTIADVMPMLDENRYIVKKGIELMKTGGNPGLAALIKELSIKNSEIHSSIVGYRLAPHVNAAGRMGSAERALHLLLAEDKGESLLLAKELCNYNLQRRATEEIILEQANRLLSQIDAEQKPLVVLWGEGWHRGVLGIVAARLSERLQRGVILISLEGDHGYGSGRGVDGMNLVELLEECAPMLEKFGGHEQAAGLTVNRSELEGFVLAVEELACRRYAPFKEAKDGMQADMCLSTLDLTLPFAESLSMLEPFGTGNRVPLFLLQDAEVEQITALSGGAHTKMLVKKEDLYYTALLFSKKTSLFPYMRFDRVDLLFELSVNEYMKRKSVQLLTRGIAPAGKTLVEYESAYKCIEGLERGEIPLMPLPTRADFVKIYLALKGMTAAKELSFSLRRLSLENGISSVAVCRLILMVFEEQGLAVFYRRRDGGKERDCFTFELIPTDKKVDIERSALYCAVRKASESLQERGQEQKKG
ncbi:MAG: single-stranded-DNA-specific exonuclease RecJ [Clostridia bacterium]|nr:single-stranded-DNA-specific exonuclease RecJ [Clostridia bacterium]